MKAPRENSLWKWLKRPLKDIRFRGLLAMSRIENAAGVGTPDVEGVYAKKSFWIELKQAAKPARPTTTIKPSKFTEAQADWLTNRWELGASTWVLIQIGPSRFLIPGYLAKEVREGRPLAWYQMNTKVAGNCTPEKVLEAIRNN